MTRQGRRAFVAVALGLAASCHAQAPVGESTAQRWEREKQEVWARRAAGPPQPESRLEHSLGRIVVIRAEFGGAPNLGAGIVIGRDKDRLYIVTANHVVRRGDAVADKVDVTFKRKPRVARVASVMVHNEPGLDLAVVSVPATSRYEIDLCADSFFGPGEDEVQRGLAVYPAGHPNGMRWMLPGTGDTVVRQDGDTIQFQSQVLSPGHSGGALLDEQGKWIGLVTADAAPFGSAVAVVPLVQKLLQWKLPILLENNGFLGMADAIEHGDPAKLAPLLDVCDPNEAGALHGPEDEFYKLPVFLAMARHTKPQMLRMLLDAGANPNVSHDAGETPLILAVRKASIKNLRDLLAAGADPNRRDGDGSTALMFASVWNKLDAARLLLDAGADLSVKNRSGQTPSNLAKTPEMEALLRERQAK